jgi:hypothetical protein
MSEIKTITTLDRRTFTLEAVLAILSGVAITISSSACGGGSSPTSPATPAPTPAPTPTPAAGDKVASISANHGHTATITGAQLTAGGAVTVELTPGNGHTHTVSLTAAEVGSIAANQRVTKESTETSQHHHDVTFN